MAFSRGISGSSTLTNDPEDRIDHGADEMHEAAKGDKAHTASAKLRGGTNTGAPKGSSRAAIKSGSGGATKKRPVAKASVGKSKVPQAK
jgi:hypothetical protein